MATTAEIQTREKLYIGGEWVDPQGSETIEVINPSTEEVIGSIPAGTAEDVDRAVGAAREAFEGWAATSREERAAYLAAISAGPGRALRGDRGDDLQRAGDAVEALGPDPGRAADDAVRRDARGDGGGRLGGADRQLAGAARAGRRARRDHALELPAEPDRAEGRAGPGRGLHRGAEAERGGTAERLHPGRDHRVGRACPRASSTWSAAPGRSPARPSPAIRGSTWSPSPARPGPASGSPSWPRRRSSRWRSSWAASRRT